MNSPLDGMDAEAGTTMRSGDNLFPFSSGKLKMISFPTTAGIISYLLGLNPFLN